ncbi:uncharacterized protein IL334_002571 [Kwoniella shivajii]|uniref:Uncharacterized protein n=1 Tax=Kwoniella shivajii TaxID=564305 RepID=A0ABZ1CVG7_9TREE|nr:hypothetical protein IL334_002571 [Kwoniella shivajii]
MAPIDIGDVGGAITGVAGTAVEGAKGAAKTASGAVATATSAVNNAKGKYDDAQGMLGWFTKIQGYITRIQDAWNGHKYLIMFLVGLIIFLYMSITIYCCYHFIHDFFRCGCCCVRCTYKSEKWIYQKIKSSSSSTNKERDDDDAKVNHKCSKCCLLSIPRTTRMELEKQHGDLRKGWSDSTYFLARDCGRIDLPQDPIERSKWHWYGHETKNPTRFRYMNKCIPTNVTQKNKDERQVKEVIKAKERIRYWMGLKDGIDPFSNSGLGSSSWEDRVNHNSDRMKKILRRSKKYTEDKKAFEEAEARSDEKEET